MICFEIVGHAGIMCIISSCDKMVLFEKYWENKSNSSLNFWQCFKSEVVTVAELQLQLQFISSFESHFED